MIRRAYHMLQNIAGLHVIHLPVNPIITTRAPDKVRIFISKMSISWPNSVFDHLLESSYRDDYNKWSNIGFGQNIMELSSIEVYFTHLIWSSDNFFICYRYRKGGMVTGCCIFKLHLTIIVLQMILWSSACVFCTISMHDNPGTLHHIGPQSDIVLYCSHILVIQMS